MKRSNTIKVKSAKCNLLVSIIDESQKKPSLIFVATLLSLHLSPHGNKAKVLQGENYTNYDCIAMTFMEPPILLFFMLIIISRNRWTLENYYRLPYTTVIIVGCCIERQFFTLHFDLACNKNGYVCECHLINEKYTSKLTSVKYIWILWSNIWQHH